MQDSVRSQISALLEEAEKLEKNANAASDHSPPQQKEDQQPPWAPWKQSADKYYEACFLIRSSSGSGSEIGDANQEEFVRMLPHYEQHARGLLEKVEGMKISNKQKPTGRQGNAVKSMRKKFEGFKISNEQKLTLRRSNPTQRSQSESDANRDPNGESNRKKKVTAIASKSLRNSWGTGQKFVKKVKRVGKTDQKQAKANKAQDCVKSDMVMKLEIEKCQQNADRLVDAALKNYQRGECSKDELIAQYMEAVRCYSRAIEILSSNGGGEMEAAAGGGSLLESMKNHKSLALNRVEELKRMIASGSPSAPPPPVPVININQASEHSSSSNQSGKLTQEEIDILMWSSHVASGVFLPWLDKDARRMNEELDGTFLGARKSECSERPPLSAKQKERGGRWARPAEIAAMRGGRCRIAMVDSITPYTIKQHCVEDCSFIAGLCISAALEHRGKCRLVSSLIYPQDAKTGMPIYNPQGIYLVKLWLNGVARRVVVDDMLPVDEQGNLLCSHTTASGKSNGSILELWVPILEKAYMKLCGGYDFPGSNSGVDLFSLTGWIPERLFLPEDPSQIRDFETPVERAWERLCSANDFGDCLITLSTSKELSEEQAEDVCLFTGHAYAVLEVVEASNGTRLLKLKNPWACNSWKGRFSPQDKASWNDPKFCKEVGYDSTSSSQYDDGVFWIEWSDIILYFRNVHLSWNPDLFRKCRTSIHGFWAEDMGPNDDSFNVGDNPQYTITLSDEAIEKKAVLWILLSRHVTKQEQEGGGVSDFLTLHLYRVENPQQRVWYPNSNCILKGAYTNNQHVLVRYDAKGPEDKALSIVLRQYEKSNNIAYTLSCYCTEMFELGDPEQSLPICQELQGAWQLRENLEDKSNLLTIGTAGGPRYMGSFGSNPQWSIRVPPGGVQTQIKCMAPKGICVNVILDKNNLSSCHQGDSNDQMGRRIHHLYKDPIIDTGPYREEFVVSDIVFLSPGLYTLCASASEVGQVGTFLLHVCSSSEVHIAEIRLPR